MLPDLSPPQRSVRKPRSSSSFASRTNRCCLSEGDFFGTQKAVPASRVPGPGAYTPLTSSTGDPLTIVVRTDGVAGRVPLAGRPVRQTAPFAANSHGPFPGPKESWENTLRLRTGAGEDYAAAGPDVGTYTPRFTSSGEPFALADRRKTYVSSPGHGPRSAGGRSKSVDSVSTFGSSPRGSGKPPNRARLLDYWPTAEPTMGPGAYSPRLGPKGERLEMGDVH